MLFSKTCSDSSEKSTLIEFRATPISSKGNFGYMKSSLAVSIISILVVWIDNIGALAIASPSFISAVYSTSLLYDCTGVSRDVFIRCVTA